MRLKVIQFLYVQERVETNNRTNFKHHSCEMGPLEHWWWQCFAEPLRLWGDAWVIIAKFWHQFLPTTDAAKLVVEQRFCLGILKPRPIHCFLETPLGEDWALALSTTLFPVNVPQFGRQRISFSSL